MTGAVSKLRISARKFSTHAAGGSGLEPHALSEELPLHPLSDPVTQICAHATITTIVKWKPYKDDGV